ncbi:hypothetical protein ACNKHK_11520 [Shigella flexneri]
MKVENWQAGLENAVVSGRLNILTHGDAGKGNNVLTLGPGKLAWIEWQMPLQLTGEAKQGNLIFYAKLPARLTGSLNKNPQLALRARGAAALTWAGRSFAGY